MDVALINPPTADGSLFVRDGRCTQRSSIWSTQWPPITLATLAAVARDGGHRPRVFDCPAQGISAAGLVRRLSAMAPGACVVSVGTPTLSADLATIDAVKKALPAARVAVIGVHATAKDEALLARCDSVDAVIRHEPEETFGEWIAVLDAGGDPTGVVGLTVRTENGIARGQERPFIDNLDLLPFPAWEHVDTRRYRLPFSTRRFLSLSPLRGCPHRCSFCTAGTYYGHKLRLRSPDSVIAEIRRAREKFSIDELFVWAETFTLHKTFVMELCAAMARDVPGIRWTCNSRTDTIDRATLAAMRRAGCWMISFGIESASAEVLARSKKNAKVHDPAEVLSLTRSYGIRTLGHFILGLPGETRESMRATMRRTRSLDLDLVQVYAAAPFVGSPLYEESVREGWIAEADEESADQSAATLRLPNLPPAAVDSAVRRTILRFYARPRQVFRVLHLAGFGVFLQIGREILRRLRARR